MAVGAVEDTGLVPKLARLASPNTATVVGVATLLLYVAGVPLAIATSHQLSGVLAVFAVFALLVPFGVVGLLIGRRRKRVGVLDCLLGDLVVGKFVGHAGTADQDALGDERADAAQLTKIRKRLRRG